MGQTTQESFSNQQGHQPSPPENGQERGMTFIQIWLTAVPMLAITVMAISANGTVLAMFVNRRGLRRCKNLYIASLALADFLVSLCMPIKLSLDLHQSWADGWPCRVYQIVRQGSMYASFLSILLITLDKWRAMHYPISYTNIQTKRMAITAVVIIWFLSFVVYSLPLLWWPNVMIFQSHRNVEHDFIQYTGDMNDSFTGNVITDSTKLIFSKQGNNTENHEKTTESHTKPFTDLSSNIVREDICPEGYHLKFDISILSTVFFYIIPILIMFVFDVSLYLKIKYRKSVEVQRSTSVTDTYFMTLKKSMHENIDNSAPVPEDPCKESLLKAPENKPINKHLAVAARGERRHSSLPAISPIIKGRTSSGRRVSMPEGNSSAGGCRYVGRKWSGCASAISGNTSPNPMANLGPRIHEDVHDILVKQDKKIARCLCILLALMVACWLPHAIVSTINVDCWCIHASTLTATSWINFLSHALNPVVYVLMNAQFKHVLKQWLLIERVHVFKMRDTLILKLVQRKVAQEEEDEESVSQKDKSPIPSAKSEHFQMPSIDTYENSSV